MQLKLAAPLHDVGKVAIPDAILLKPGPLTPAERAIVETHAEEGYRILRGSSSAILELASRIALGHHRRNARWHRRFFTAPACPEKSGARCRPGCAFPKAGGWSQPMSACWRNSAIRSPGLEQLKRRRADAHPTPTRRM